MSSVLTVKQREQAGSDAYNRFEYQVHWIVYHIIKKLQHDRNCIVLCEFHDDMAEYSVNEKQYQFFQIKTKEKADNWSLAELTRREKRKCGYKNSFLGFIFYNYQMFDTECSHCHFTSNNGFDQEIRLWQSCIEDGKSLQKENIDLYNRIKERIKAEYENEMPDNFDSVFDKFVQNTFIDKSDLQLESYESQTRGYYFEFLSNNGGISVNTANLIYQQLVDNVRKKSKEKVETPISFKSLVEKKGIKVEELAQKIDIDIIKSGNNDLFHDYLVSKSLPSNDIKRIKSAKLLHDIRWLDTKDIKYQEIVICLRKTISEYCDSNVIDQFCPNIEEICNKELEKHDLVSESLDKSLVEVLFYEYKSS